MLQSFYQKTGWFKKLLIKGVILYGAILTALYMGFRAYYINLDPHLVVWAILLYLAELHTIILMFGFLYSLWPRNYKKYSEENNNLDLDINMFVTVAGEPTEVVRKTIEHAKRAADYYYKKVRPNKKPKVIVLNDGKAAKKPNWQEVEQICKKLGVYHVARESNEGFKAGNINNGLKVFPSRDTHNTIDCFFDSDFCAKENFLIEILKPLKDDTVDFVQSPQRYSNLNTWVAKAAGAHQIFFFDYICPAKAYDNALFLCGTNYAIRREALLAAGGVDNRFVTEDYATSIRLHLNGNRGVFIPDVLAVGMAPMNLKEYFNQQMRWCKGCLDANGKYLKELFFGGLTWRQKFHYFLSTAYYFLGVRDLILVLAPLPYLFWGTSLIRANTLTFLAMVYLPLVIYNFALFFVTFKNPVKSLVLDIVSFPVFAKAFLSSMVGKNLPFTITIKKYEKENPFVVYRMQLVVAITLLIGLVYSLIFRNPENIGGYINYFWATYSMSFLLIGFWMVVRENFEISIKLIPDLPKPVSYAIRTALFISILFTAGFSIPFAIQKSIDSRYGQDALAMVKLEEKKELLVPSSGAYYGYYLTDNNLHPENPATSVLEGENTSLTMYYQDWNEESKFNKRFMDNLYEQGVIPVVTWEPSDLKKLDAKINEMGKTSEVVTSGEYDEHIREWAKGAKSYGKPMFLRFAHEMNGNWYAWGDLNENSADEYIAMWRHVHKIFTEVGADNVIWVWSPNNTNHFGKTDTVMNFYPGGAYVDWAGYSAFNWGNTNYKQPLWRKFDYISYDVYNTLSILNKPIMVSETSSVSTGGNKETWFLNTLGLDIPKMDKIKAVVMFNQDFKDADFRLDSGMNYQSVYEKVIKENSYFVKDPIVVSR